MSITRFQTEEECATSEHVGRDTAAQLHAREHKHKAAQPPSLHTQSQLKTTEVWGWGWGEQSSVFTENTKTGYRVCALLCHGCGTQRPYEDVTLYICTLTIKSMWNPQNRPENSFFCVEECQETRRQTFSPPRWLGGETQTPEVWLNVITGGCLSCV